MIKIVTPIAVMYMAIAPYQIVPVSTIEIVITIITFLVAYLWPAK
jgi:hypothetical protein